LAGAVISVAAVAAVTGVVHFVRPHAPVFSLATLYVLAVLPIAVIWGRGFAVVTSVLSMLAFNYFFLPPTLTFSLSGEENWVALVVFLVTGVVVADLASRARRRATEAEQRHREAAVLAELSTVLLSGAQVRTELARIAEGAARVLRVTNATIEFDIPDRRHDRVWLPLLAGERLVGTVYVPANAPIDEAVTARFLPALASLLAVAIDRERLEHEALEAEALRRSDSMKTALLRAVSHDLRSPLTAIRVAVESLVNPSLTLDHKDRRSLLETVHEEARRLDRLVGNLLDLSRLEAGAASPQRELRSLDGVLTQALEQLRGGERVDVSLPDEPLLVHADGDQLERVLVNLLENALKFSPDQSTVSVKVENAGDEALVIVENDGTGFAPHERERIFRPFQHGSAPSERRGTGLGLAIARGFAEANGGRVTASSRPGEGASFTLVLPLADASVVA
jgi:two-component system sensor histidine kinase KdpD